MTFILAISIMMIMNFGTSPPPDKTEMDKLWMQEVKHSESVNEELPKKPDMSITIEPSQEFTVGIEPQDFIPKEPENSLTPQQAMGISDSDYTLFAAIVNAEDGADSFDNKVAVACVIFNRMESEDYSGTVREVITEKGQFSTYSQKKDCAYNPYTGKEVYATDECKEAILYAYLYRPLPVDVLYFCAYDYFDGLEEYQKIGDNYYSYG